MSGREKVARASSLLAAAPEFLLAAWCGHTFLRLLAGGPLSDNMAALFVPTVEVIGLLVLRLFLLGGRQDRGVSMVGWVARLLGTGIALWFYGGLGLLFVVVMFFAQPVTGMLLALMLFRRIAFAFANRPRFPGDDGRVRAYLSLAWRSAFAAWLVAMPVALLASLILFGFDPAGVPEDLLIAWIMMAMTAYFGLLGFATIGESPGTVLPDDEGRIAHPPVPAPDPMVLVAAFVAAWPVMIPGMLLTAFLGQGLAGQLPEQSRIIGDLVFTAMGAWLLFAGAAWASGRGCREDFLATGLAGASNFLRTVLLLTFATVVIAFFAVAGLVIGVGGYDVDAYVGEALPLRIQALSVAAFAVPILLWLRTWPVLVVPFLLHPEEDRQWRRRTGFLEGWRATEGTPALLGASIWVVGTLLGGLLGPLLLADAVETAGLWSGAGTLANVWCHLVGAPALAVVAVDRAIALGLAGQKG